jgi:hypothetical protein
MNRLKPYLFSPSTVHKLATDISSRTLLASGWPAIALLLTGCSRSLHTGLQGWHCQLTLSRVSFWGSYRWELTNMPKITSSLGLCEEISHSILNHLILLVHCQCTERWTPEVGLRLTNWSNKLFKRQQLGFMFSNASRLAVEPTDPPVQLPVEALSLDWSGLGEKLTPHFRLVPRFKWW